MATQIHNGPSEYQFNYWVILLFYDSILSNSTRWYYWNCNLTDLNNYFSGNYGTANSIPEGSGTTESIGGKYNQNFENYKMNPTLGVFFHNDSCHFTNLLHYIIQRSKYTWDIRLISISMLYFRIHIWNCIRLYIVFLNVPC